MLANGEIANAPERREGGGGGALLCYPFALSELFWSEHGVREHPTAIPL
jgi:hypothetical protein